MSIQPIYSKSMSRAGVQGEKTNQHQKREGERERETRISEGRNLNGMYVRVPDCLCVSYIFP
jgi:hypothetical protein